MRMRMSGIKKMVYDIIKRGPVTFEEIVSELVSKSHKCSFNYLRHIISELRSYGLIDSKVVYVLKKGRVDEKE